MVQLRIQILLLFLLPTILFGQEASPDIYIPLGAIRGKIYVEKYEPISIAEASNYIDEGASTFKIKRMNNSIEDFNIYGYKFYNNYMERVFRELADTNFQLVYKRDLEENLDSSYRFVIRWAQSPDEFSGTGYYRYIIHDLQTGKDYGNFGNIESLVESIKKARSKFGKSETATQEDVNAYYIATYPKEKVRKNTPAAVKWTLWILLYTGFVIGINVLINL